VLRVLSQVPEERLRQTDLALIRGQDVMNGGEVGETSEALLCDLHGDLHLGPNVRFFGQLQSGFETGLIGGPRPDVDVDVFDAHQGFLGVVWRWGEEEAIGRFGHGEIDAWTAANAVRYNFEGLPLRPRLGVRFDLASGDLNPHSPNLQTFNPLFLSGAYFNLANPNGPQNIIDLHPVLDLNFGEKVTTTAAWNFFWRESLEDGIYSLSGVPLRPGTPSRARYVGSTPSLTAAWKATRHVTVLASYVHVFAGPYLKENPPAKDIDYVTVWIDYTF
jgi:hypothetical protein